MFTYLKRRKELARHERALKLIRNSNTGEMKLIQEYAEQERVKILRRLRHSSPLTDSRLNLIDKFIIGLGAIMVAVSTFMILGRLLGRI